MPKLKIAVNMRPVNGPWGGGNQFVKQFSRYLVSQGHAVTYRLEPDIQAILIVKSWDTQTTEFDIPRIREFKQSHPGVVCVHRINECDQRKHTDNVDELLRRANEVADITVFISHWLKDYFSKLWFDPGRPHYVIQNGADEIIFHPDLNNEYSKGCPLRVITHHWSDNWMKGFKVYQELDGYIAEGRIEGFAFTVLGRWPREINWRKTQTFPPASGSKLAEMLRKNHVYLTASLWEPCGMHHIEAAQCGLPLIYHEDGGGIVEFGKKYGVGFRDNLIDALCFMRENYSQFRKKVLESAPSGMQMCQSYERIFLK